MAKPRRLRAEALPHNLSSQMQGASQTVATQQNFDSIQGQMAAMVAAINDIEEVDEVDQELDVPAFSVGFRKIRRRKRTRYNATVRVTVPADDDDVEVSRVVAQMQYVTSGGAAKETDNGDPVYHTKRVRVPDEEDDDASDITKLKLHFRNLDHPKTWYVRFRAKYVVRGGRHSDWSDWSSPVLPFNSVAAGSPGSISNLQVTTPTARRWVWTWDEPTGEDDAAFRYKVTVKRKDGGAWTTVETGYTRNERYVYRAPKADRDQNHRANVKCIDDDGVEEGAGTEAAEAAPSTDTVDGGEIEPGTVDFPAFAAGIKPPYLSASAPALPDSRFPIGSFYYNTTTKRLYETKNGTSWTESVTFSNLSGTISASQITANTIGADKIVANSLTAGEIAAGAIGASELAVNAMTAKVMTTNSGSDSNYITIDGDTASNRDQIQFNSGGGQTVMSAANGGIKFGGGVGAKLGFWGSSPVAKTSVSTLTDSTGGATNGDVEDVSGVSAAVNRNFAELTVKLNELIDQLKAYGIV